MDATLGYFPNENRCGLQRGNVHYNVRMQTSKIVRMLKCSNRMLDKSLLRLHFIMKTGERPSYVMCFLVNEFEFRYQR